MADTATKEAPQTLYENGTASEHTARATRATQQAAKQVKEKPDSIEQTGFLSLDGTEVIPFGSMRGMMGANTRILLGMMDTTIEIWKIQLDATRRSAEILGR